MEMATFSLRFVPHLARIFDVWQKPFHASHTQFLHRAPTAFAPSVDYTPQLRSHYEHSRLGTASTSAQEFGYQLDEHTLCISDRAAGKLPTTERFDGGGRGEQTHVVCRVEPTESLGARSTDALVQTLM